MDLAVATVKGSSCFHEPFSVAEIETTLAKLTAAVISLHAYIRREERTRDLNALNRPRRDEP
jgi:hypothetical protein